MNLSAEQETAVRSWVEEGVGLAEVQRRLEGELGVKATFLETRFLVDDLQLSIQSPPEPAKPEAVQSPEPTSVQAGQLVDSSGQPTQSEQAAEAAAQEASVSVSLDELTIPGALVSGKVSFSDGQSGRWYLDQMGRMGFEGASPDYRPSEEDLAEFQVQLQALLKKQGL